MPSQASAHINELRLVGIAGTNKVMAGELSRLARRAFTDTRLPAPEKEGLATLRYPFHRETAGLAVRYHRTSSRVLWGLFRSRAQRLEPLYEELCAAVTTDRRPWFWDGASFSVVPANVGRFAAGGRQVVGVVKNALIEGAGSRGVRLRVNPESPDLRVDVRMEGDALTVSLDLAGRPMNQRGYRPERGRAPLRENLAAVLVMLTRHDARVEALIDPLAGSGTIPIEAACMGQGRPVWVPPREPAAQRLPFFADAMDGEAVPLFGDTRPLVFSNERDRATCRMAARNAALAGVDAWVQGSCGDFQDMDPEVVLDEVRSRGLDPGRGVILGNPPYGERLDPAHLSRAYRELGAWCRRFRGWRAGFLVANPEFETAFGQRPRIKKPLNNGPLRGHFYLFEL